MAVDQVVDLLALDERRFLKKAGQSIGALLRFDGDERPGAGCTGIGQRHSISL